MASKADKLKARMERASAAPAPEETTKPPVREPVPTGQREPVNTSTPAPPPAAPSPKGRTKPIKMTVDLAPVEHRRLKLWCAQAAAELELPEVAASEVVRTLVGLLQEDVAVAERVRAELVRSGGSRRGWA